MNVIYFSTLAWDEAGGAHNPTQISRALAQRGHSVLFVEPQPAATRNVERLPIEIVALTELGMTQTELRRAWFGLPTGELAGVAKNVLARISETQTRVAIFSAPFDPFVRMIPLLRAHHFKIVYYAMDDFAAAPALGYTQFVTDAEIFLVHESDVLLGVTPHIANSLARFGNRAHVIPNGIDANLWQRNAARTPNVQRGELTLGFWGTLMDAMFDAEIVAHVARAHPRWRIHLLGAVDPEPHRPSVRERLKDFPNIFFHGAIAHAELPKYAAAFDVALAPFPENDFTRGRDPIKIYEYLAAQLPVVASYAPQLEQLPYVRVAYSPQEFAQAIQDAAQTRVHARVLNEFLAQQTWAARADMLLQILGETHARSNENASPEILPSFAKPDAHAVMRYANALEQELASVTQWARELEAIAQARSNPSIALGTSLERVKRFVPTFGRRN